MWDVFTDSENKIVPKLKWILKLKTKMLSEYIKLITWLRLFNIAAVKLLHKTQCHDPKSSVEIQETQESQNNPEKEQQTVCQDLFYLISVWARRAFQPGLPVTNSAAGEPVLQGNQCCQEQLYTHMQKNEVGFSICIIHSGSHTLI